jgi:hypothetical protein
MGWIGNLGDLRSLFRFFVFFIKNKIDFHWYFLTDQNDTPSVRANLRLLCPQSQMTVTSVIAG